MTITFPSALVILFICLKLTGVIAWSWLWVFAPLWAPLTIMLVIWMFAMLMAFVIESWQRY